MIIQNDNLTAFNVASGVATGVKTVSICYGTSAERLAMTADQKKMFVAGSTYMETDTGLVYIFDEASNDFQEI